MGSIESGDFEEGLRSIDTAGVISVDCGGVKRSIGFFNWIMGGKSVKEALYVDSDFRHKRPSICICQGSTNKIRSGSVRTS